MLLYTLIVLPLAGGLAAWLLGRSRPPVARWTALVTAAASAVVCAVGAGAVSASGPEGIAVRPFTGSSLLGMRLDGLSLPLVVLTGLLGVVSVLASWRVEERPGTFMALLLSLQAAVTAVFLADDLVLFYVAWEAVLIPMFFLIGRWGHENREHAAMKFFIYTFAGSALMLVGIVIMVVATGTTSMTEGLTALARMAAGSLPAFGTANIRVVVFWLLAAGFAVKVPVWPLHTWLPDAHVEAPTAGSIMLAGVMLKMGGYGFLRLGLAVSPGTARAAAPLFATLGVIAIVYGAMMALAQSDLKRLVAYSSVAHMGFLVLALAVGTPLALSAAMLVMVAHGVTAGLLFLLVGQIYERTHTREMDRMGGLLRQVPAWGTVFVLAALASVGLPGLAGFPGELAATLEGFKAFGWWMVVVAVGVVLAGVYNLRAVRNVAHGPLADEWTSLSDLDFAEGAAVAPLAAAVVLLGVWPSLVTTVGQPAIEALARLLGRA